MLFRRLSPLVFLAFASFAAGCAPEADAVDADQEPLDVAQQAESIPGFSVPAGVGVLIPQTLPLVKEIYAHEAKAWIKWAMGLPFSTGPITDTTGAACGQGQSGPVWYLAGTPGGALTRSCTIPRHKFLFVPLINHWVLPDPQYVSTPADLADYKNFIAGYIPDLRAHTCNLAIKVDGAPLLTTEAQLDAKLWTQVTNPFTVVVNDDNFASQYGQLGYTTPAGVTAGHYALLRPLSPGTHLLEYSGAMCDDLGAVEFENSIVLNLTVAP